MLCNVCCGMHNSGVFAKVNLYLKELRVATNTDFRFRVRTNLCAIHRALSGYSPTRSIPR